jgi:hypothetical protein
MANYLGVDADDVKNYTLTVYWYLNSSIVYKDAFNLTKRGYNVEKVAIADVTFVLAISARQRQTSQRPLRQNMVVQRNRRHNNSLPRPHHSRPRPQDMDIHSRTRNPRSSQMDRRQNNTTMATNIREIHQTDYDLVFDDRNSTDGSTRK